MFKFSALLFAAVAVQAIFAISTDESWQRQQNHVQMMSNKIREVADDVSNSIQNVQADTNKGRRALMELANEFAHNVQNVVYEMQQVAQSTQGEDRKVLQQICQELSETTYSVQQAMNSEPNQMKNKLKEQVQKIATEAEKLTRHLQQAQKPQRDQDDHMRAMKRAMMDLHVTVKKVQIQIRNQNKNVQEVSNKMQELANQMNMYTQNVQNDDEQAVRDLADFVQRMSQHMNNMVDKIQREANDQHGQTKQIMHQVANKMSEMRTDLEKAANTHGNTQQKATELKQQLERVMRDCSAEMQKLMQAGQQSNDQEGQGIKALIKNVMDEGVAVAETTQSQLKMMKK
ncbi:hypothetical protein ILUMI_18924 [Ignelater luminosus]|uniref:Transcription regulator YsiA C-terminal domain-containing protein n=1 Tax=Ignelater luminosus TaxID=2038154 RepID=A0A8K0G629_IGNLU|nr:hypothetical protein ILUMI_18924 [Ignelater luminosus]